MPLPAAVPGRAIRYSYLWHSEHLAGRKGRRTGLARLSRRCGRPTIPAKRESSCCPSHTRPSGLHCSVAYGMHAPGGEWFGNLRQRKPSRVATVALASKIARIAWAVLTRGEAYRAAVDSQNQGSCMIGPPLPQREALAE